MALHFLVDGYNVIHQMPQLDQGKLEVQRLGLIHHIEHHRPQGSIKNKVTVVFDGQGGHLSAPLSSMIETVFSVGESADEKIKTIVDQSKNARNIVVVTDDRDVQSAVRQSGAQVVSVNEFLSKSQGRQRHNHKRLQPLLVNLLQNLRHTNSTRQNATHHFKKKKYSVTQIADKSNNTIFNRGHH